MRRCDEDAAESPSQMNASDLAHDPLVCKQIPRIMAIARSGERAEPYVDTDHFPKMPTRRIIRAGQKMFERNSGVECTCAKFVYLGYGCDESQLIWTDACLTAEIEGNRCRETVEFEY